jgi:hypothetical protein
VQVLGRGAEYAAFLAAGGPTLLDGELILRESDRGTGTGARAVFMAFDCAACNGHDLASAAGLDERRVRPRALEHAMGVCARAQPRLAFSSDNR